MRRGIVFTILVFIAFGCKNKADESSYLLKTEEQTGKEDVVSGKKKTILCFGNSLTAGYGLEKEQAYPALLQDRVDSLKYNYQVINAGVSGETTSGGLGRIDWMLRQQVDIFILELGANDGLRGVATSETQKNLEEIINRVKETYPEVKIILAGMKVPPNMGGNYGSQFEVIFPQVAENKKVALIPFFLEGVAGKPELNQTDGIHPTVDGTKIVLENVWAVLKQELGRG